MRTGGTAGLIVLVVVCAVSAFLRNEVWQTDFSLYADVLRKTSSKARIHNNVGVGLMQLGRYPEAIAEYKEALAVDSSYIAAYYNIAESMEKMGQGQEAASYYLLFCRLASPKFPEETRIACERATLLGGADSRQDRRKP